MKMYRLVLESPDEDDDTWRWDQRRKEDKNLIFTSFWASWELHGQNNEIEYSLVSNLKFNS